MTTGTTASYLLAALLLLAQGSALAAPADPDEEEPEEAVAAPWSLALATQVDQGPVRGFTGELGRDLTPKTTVHVAADAIDYPTNLEASYKSVGLTGGASHDFKHLRIEAAVAHWQATDIVNVNELKLGADWRASPWTAGLRGGYRWSDFNPLDTTATSVVTGTVMPAAATCHLHNLEGGADGRFQGSVWGAYATIMSYRYSEADCHVHLVDGTLQKVRLGKAPFVTLAAAFVDRLGAVALRHIGRDETLLASSVDAGASWTHEDFVVSLDYSRQKEYFLGGASKTYSTTGTADLGHGTGVDCTVGLTRGGGVTNGAFVGFAVRARF